MRTPVECVSEVHTYATSPSTALLDLDRSQESQRAGFSEARLLAQRYRPQSSSVLGSVTFGVLSWVFCGNFSARSTSRSPGSIQVSA